MGMKKKVEIKCDCCGEVISNDKTFPVYDENYNLQEGLIKCEKCFNCELGYNDYIC
jgi:hypothetical protein